MLYNAGELFLHQVHLSIAHLGKTDSVLTLILRCTSSNAFNNNWLYKDTLIKGQDF